MPKTILIVDDDADVRKNLADIFAEYGHKIIEAETGQEALKKARKNKPDVILLDTKIPGVDGFEICRRIKKIEKLDSKVIVYTGKVDAIDAVKARRMGADDYCVKGAADFSLLVKAVKQLI